VLEEHERDAKHIFAFEVLSRCVRLGYWDRVRKAVPDDFENLMPPQVKTNNPFAGELEGDAAVRICLCLCFWVFPRLT